MKAKRLAFGWSFFIVATLMATSNPIYRVTGYRPEWTRQGIALQVVDR